MSSSTDDDGGGRRPYSQVNLQRTNLAAAVVVVVHHLLVDYAGCNDVDCNGNDDDVVAVGSVDYYCCYNGMDDGNNEEAEVWNVNVIDALRTPIEEMTPPNMSLTLKQEEYDMQLEEMESPQVIDEVGLNFVVGVV